MKLVKYDAARLALQAANSVDEVKDIRDKAQAMAAYARQAKDTELVEWATEIKVRAERRAGEMLRDSGIKAGNPQLSKTTTIVGKLPDLGISRDQSSRWQKLAAVPEDKFEQAVAAAKEVAGEVTTAALLRLNHNHRAQGTGENEWYTPTEYIEHVRTFLGEIDLDPASSAQAQMTVKAKKFFCIKDDGLSHKWKGRIFLNPPYAQPAIEQFSEKMISEVRAGNVIEAIMLTHNYTDTAWFHTATTEATAICFTRGRIAFVDRNGKKAAPTQGQAFFYYGKRAKEFTKEFRRHGFVVCPS